MRPALAVALCAGLAACSYEVKTPEITLQPHPREVLSVSFSSATAVLATSDGDRPMPEIANGFRDSLVSESSGVVHAGVAAPLNLRAAFRFNEKSLVEQTSALFATFTLFVPPLAFVPEQVQTSYALDYGLFDPQNRLVYQAALPGTVDGSFTGWYIGRIFTSRDALQAEHAYAARNAARAVLNDMFAHAAAIAAALQNMRGEAAASEEPTEASAGSKSPASESPQGPAAKPWWQK